MDSMPGDKKKVESYATVPMKEDLGTTKTRGPNDQGISPAEPSNRRPGERAELGCVVL